MQRLGTWRSAADLSPQGSRETGIHCHPHADKCIWDWDSLKPALK